MLFEIKNVSQTEPGLTRRWFSDEYFDLFTWQGGGGHIHRFELSYAKNRREHALIWDERNGYLHRRVDDGEYLAGEHYKMSPILVSNGTLQETAIADLFGQASGGIDHGVADFVYRKLREYQGSPGDWPPA